MNFPRHKLLCAAVTLPTLMIILTGCAGKAAPEHEAELTAETTADGSATFSHLSSQHHPDQKPASSFTPSPLIKKSSNTVYHSTVKSVPIEDL